MGIRTEAPFYNSRTVDLCEFQKVEKEHFS